MMVKEIIRLVVAFTVIWPLVRQALVSVHPVETLDHPDQPSAPAVSSTISDQEPSVRSGQQLRSVGSTLTPSNKTKLSASKKSATKAASKRTKQEQAEIPALTHVQQEPALTLAEAEQKQPQEGRQKVLITSLIFGPAINIPRFRLFVETCRTAGDDYEFLLLGDTPPSFELPPNVKHHNISWPQLVDRVVEKVFHGNTTRQNPKKMKRLYDSNGYKKCNDYKPLFGYLFPELAQGYDWWGHCDNDMLMGNLTKFIPQSDLTNFDVISGDTERASHHSWGPFTLYRNTKVINELFLSAPKVAKRGNPFSLEDLFLNDHHHHFDEAGRSGNAGGAAMCGIIKQLGQGLGIRSMRTTVAMVWDGGDCLWNKLGPTKKRCGECIYYKNGTLFRSRDREEVFLCHYQKGKKVQDETLSQGNLFETLLEDGNFNASYGSGFSRVVGWS